MPVFVKRAPDEYQSFTEESSRPSSTDYMGPLQMAEVRAVRGSQVYRVIAPPSPQNGDRKVWLEDSNALNGDRNVRLEDLLLPPCLEIVDGGIRISGHRVPLASFLHEFFNGQPSLQRFHELFPTVPRRKLVDVAVYCQQYRDVVYNYYREQVKRANAQYAQRRGLTLSQLRARQDPQSQ